MLSILKGSIEISLADDKEETIDIIYQVFLSSPIDLIHCNDAKKMKLIQGESLYLQQ